MEQTNNTSAKSFKLNLYLERSKDVFIQIYAKIERTSDKKTHIRFYVRDEKDRMFKFSSNMTILWTILLSDLDALEKFLIDNLELIPFSSPSSYRDEKCNLFNWKNMCWILKNFNMALEATDGPSVFEMKFYAYDKTGLRLAIFKNKDLDNGKIFYANDAEIRNFAFEVSSYLEASINT